MNRLFGLTAAAALAGLGCLLGAGEAFAGFTVSKTTGGTFTQEFDWTIVKTADKTAFDLEEGDSETVTYTIDLTKTEGAQSDLKVSGVITLVHTAGSDNINTIEDTVSGESAANISVGSCTDVKAATKSAGNQLNNGNTPWTCPYGPLSVGGVIGSRTNTALVNDSVPSGAIAVNFTLTGTVDDQINITDNMGTPSQTIFNASGQATIERTFTFANTCEGETFVDGEAEVVVINTATFDSTDTDATGSDDATVTITCIEPEMVPMTIEKTLLDGPLDDDGAPMIDIGGHMLTSSLPDAGGIWIGLEERQHFQFSIKFTNDTDDDIADQIALDVVPAEYNLDPDAEDAFDGNSDSLCADDDAPGDGCDGVTSDNITKCTVSASQAPGASQGNQPKKEPEFLTIDLINLIEDDMCTITVWVVTDGNPGHCIGANCDDDDGTNDDFDLFEPTSCNNLGNVVLGGMDVPANDTISLNDGVKLYAALQDGEDPMRGQRVTGPVGSLQLTPNGCDFDDDGVQDLEDFCPLDGPPDEGEEPVPGELGCFEVP